MYIDHRAVERRTESASDPCPDQQRPRQSRATRVGDEIDIDQRDAGICKDLAGQGEHAPYVITRSKLRYDAAIGLVHVNLTMESVGQQLRNPDARFAAHDSDAGFVARGLQAQNNHQDSVRGGEPVETNPREPGGTTTNETLSRLVLSRGQ